MNIVAITPEIKPHNEALLVAQLFDVGLQRLHLRRPTLNQEGMRRLIEEINPQWYRQLVLHDHHSLATEYQLGGIHLNQRNPHPPDGFCGSVSRSCHTFDEVSRNNYSYCFLSPVFNSISKNGYNAAFTQDELANAHRRGIITHRVLALGGVTLENIDKLPSWGFGGAALLGWLWSGDAVANYKKMAHKVQSMTANATKTKTSTQ